MKTYILFLIGSAALLLPNSAVSQSAPQWSVTPAQYEHFMTVTGTVVLNGTVNADSNYWVGAFVGEQCRGVAKPAFMLDRWIIFLLTYGNVQGEQLTFRVYDGTSGKTYSVTEALLFQVSAAVGQPAAPFVFHSTTTPVVNSDAPLLTFQLHQNYPNPFNPATTLRYSIPEKSEVRLSVYSALGQKISEMISETKEAGSYEHSFNASQLSSGIYFYRIEAVSEQVPGRVFIDTKKMILMK